MKALIVSGMLMAASAGTLASDLDLLQGKWEAEVDEAGTKVTYRVAITGAAMAMEAVGTKATAEVELFERETPKKIDLKNFKIETSDGSAVGPALIPGLY